MAPTTSRTGVIWRFNDLQPGAVYLATTPSGVAVGEYLGIETHHGEWAILLRDEKTTTSVPLRDVAAIKAA